MVTGFVLSVLARVTEVFDNSITTVTGLIGLIGAIVWLLISLTKRKQIKLALENEELDNKIKKQQLKNISEKE
jgi:hypothetical protein